MTIHYENFMSQPDVEKYVELYCSILENTTDDWQPLYAKENFENCYKQYHELGANGFMDKLIEEFLELPMQNNEKVV